MAISKISAPENRARAELGGRVPAWRQERGFSLVEVVLALGIMAFAFVGIVSLLPTGLGVFRQSLNTSVGSLIAQRIINDAQQTDFSQLIAGTGGSPATQPFRQVNPLDPAHGEVRWFDAEGTELAGATGAIFQVNTQIAPTTLLPETAAATANPQLATVTVQVATNPGNQPLAFSSSDPNLWSGLYQNNLGAPPIITVSALIGKNQ